MRLSSGLLMLYVSDIRNLPQNLISKKFRIGIDLPIRIRKISSLHTSALNYQLILAQDSMSLSRRDEAENRRKVMKEK